MYGDVHKHVYAIHTLYNVYDCIGAILRIGPLLVPNCLTDSSVVVLQHVMHLPGMHPQAGVVDPGGLPGMGPQPLEMALDGALALLLGILGMTRMHPPGGTALPPLEGQRHHPQPGAVLDGRQMQSRQCVCAERVLCLSAVLATLTCTIEVFFEQNDGTCGLKLTCKT